MTSISVVMTTYNGEKYIVEQLDSIRCQTMTPDEVIICDDVSSDGTRRIIRDYIKKYNLTNWFFYENEYNKGWRRNFIDTIKLSTGNYIFLSDQDDIWETRKIEYMYGAMERKSDISLLVGDSTIIYSEQRTPKSRRLFYSFRTHAFYLDSIWNGNGLFSNVNKVMKGKKKYTGSVKPILFNEKIFCSQKQGCVMALKRELFDTYEKYWSKECPHDSLLWYGAAIEDSLFYLDMPVIKYRHHNYNTGFSDTLGEGLTRFTEIKKIDAFLRQLNSFALMLEDCNVTDTEKKKQLIRKIYDCYLMRKKFLEKKKIKYLLKNSNCKYIVGKRQYYFDILLAFFT